MTTTASPWAESDRKLRQSYRARDAAEQFRYLDGLSAEALKEKLTTIEVAQVELANLEQLLAGYRSEIAAAVNRHQMTTEPLQTELSDPATPTARKVECRAAVIAANADLEAAVGTLKKNIKAAEAERDIQRSIVGGRTTLENAFVNSAPEAERERVWVLKKVCERLEQGILDQANREAANASRALNWIRETQEERRQANRRQGIKAEINPPNASLAERAANRASAIASIVAGWMAQCRTELQQIREKRVAELYD